MNILIVEDEELSAERLHKLIGDEIPKLIFSVGSAFGSCTDYNITFSIQNNDDFPVYDVVIKVIPEPAKRHPLPITGRKTENELKLEKVVKGN